MTREMVHRSCAYCHAYPCVCRRSAYCSCGLTFVVAEDIATSIRIHQATTQHAAWRARHNL